MLWPATLFPWQQVTYRSIRSKKLLLTGRQLPQGLVLLFGRLVFWVLLHFGIPHRMKRLGWYYSVT